MKHALQKAMSFFHLPIKNSLPGKPAGAIALQEKQIVQFEKVLQVNYNQDVSKLEALIGICDHTGYNRNICAAGSPEYVRFFVDAGKGFQNAGFTFFQVYDYTIDGLSKKRPQQHLVQLFYENKRQNNVIRVRAVLSWNEVPPLNPDWVPLFGNVLDTTVLLKSSDKLLGELLDEAPFRKLMPYKYTY